jgi:membrane dipeptidase
MPNEVNKIHKEIVVCDAHCDTVDRLIKGADLGTKSPKGQVDIPRLIEGSVKLQVFASCIDKSGKSPEFYSQFAKKKLNTLHQQFNKHSKSIELALKLSDVHKINQKGKISAMLAIESGQAIENDIGKLHAFYNQGVRIMTLTWKSTDWADASQEKMKHNGLTVFGKSVVKEMNKLGMIVDISHSADKTVVDVLKTSNDPVIASHSCAKAICDHPRNLSDKLIKDIANSGGVICVNFYALHLDQKFKNAYDKKENPEPPSFTKVIDHIEHVIKIGGIDAVGLGSDFDGRIIPPKGLEDASKMPKITESLLARGYLEEEIVKIMGGNFLRVFGQVCGV